MYLSDFIKSYSPFSIPILFVFFIAGAVTNDSETLTRFEVMDGAPIKGERIPIRLHLAGLDVGPTLLSVGNVLNVRYFLNLVLVDEEDRRYFKQQEITLYREKVKGSTSI